MSTGVVQVKVCGATCDYEVDQAVAGGADLVGLWWGVPGSVFSLTTAEVAELAAHFPDGSTRPCLVTFEKDPFAIADCLRRTGVRVVQLHAFQTPETVRVLRSEVGPGVRIVKVLHCTQDTCLDLRFARAYEAAGVDLFVLDAVDGSRIGSTGSRIPASVAVATLDALSTPALLAGGLSPFVPADYRRVTTHPRFAGVDVDSASRDCDGLINEAAVAALLRSWQAPVPVGLAS